MNKVSGQKSKRISTAEFIREGAARTIDRQEAQKHEQ